MVRFPRRVSASARWCRRLAVFAVPVGLLTTLLHRFGQIDTPAALALLGLVLAMAGLALVLALAGIVSIWRRGRHGVRNVMLGSVLALATLALPAWHAIGLFTLPRLHDVTTDWQQPPRLRAAVDDRPAWAGNPEYARDGVVRQATAYPQIVPFFADYDAGLVYETALALVAGRGWRVLATRVPSANAPGRIEAVASTLVFGFEDDVIIRITPRGIEATRVDMRSASRIGGHDLGANARRIVNFLTDLRDGLELQVDLDGQALDGGDGDF